MSSSPSSESDAPEVLKTPWGDVEVLACEPSRSKHVVLAQDDDVAFDYDGEISTDDRPHGTGSLKFNDGSTYKGMFHKGLEHGQGIWESETGLYSGQWRNGEMHGVGQYWYKEDGNWFSGTLQHERFVCGTLHYNNATVYSGQFEADQPHGQGTHTFDGHDVYTHYEGGFNKGRFDGHGILHSKDGGVFSGRWQEDNLVWGKMSLSQPLGGRRIVSYTGEVKGGLPHGKGQCTLEDGRCFEGRFEGGEFEFDAVTEVPVEYMGDGGDGGDGGKGGGGKKRKQPEVVEAVEEEEEEEEAVPKKVGRPGKKAAPSREGKEAGRKRNTGKGKEVVTVKKETPGKGGASGKSKDAGKGKGKEKTAPTPPKGKEKTAPTPPKGKEKAAKGKGKETPSKKKGGKSAKTAEDWTFGAMVIYKHPLCWCLGKIMAVDAEDPFMEVHRFESYSRPSQCWAADPEQRGGEGVILLDHKHKFTPMYTDPKDGKAIFTAKRMGRYKEQLDVVAFKDIGGDEFELERGSRIPPSVTKLQHTHSS